MSLAAVGDGWKRVVRFPTGLAAVAIAMAVVTLPAALSVKSALEGHLGASLAGARVATGVDVDWWDEFRDSGAPESFQMTIIGGAAPMATYSDLLDRTGPALSVVVAVLAGGMFWLFLSGGLLDRYARRRRVGTRGFFGACGVFFFRFLRLAVLTGLAYAFLVGPFHTWWFSFYEWFVRDTTVERTAFLWRLVFYATWLLPLLLVNAAADYAKARAVLEDRHSMIGALVAGVRFMRRHPTEVTVVYAANAAIAAVVLGLYVLLAPDGRGGDWRLVGVVAVGAAYLIARLAARLAFLASALALVEHRLAHAEYTAPPLPVWPDSPAAEAIENLRRAEFGVPSEVNS